MTAISPSPSAKPRHKPAHAVLGALRPRNIRVPEHVEAVNLVRWVSYQIAVKPALRLFHAIPNGGARSKATAGKLKAEGVKSGVLDYMLPVARGPWHGLYLELKALDGRPTPQQTRFAQDVIAEGYAAVFCKGWSDAARALDEYLALGPYTGPGVA